MADGAAKLTSRHYRAARAILGTSREDIAEKAGVSSSTVKNAERGATLSTLASRALRHAFEAEGVIFLTDEILRNGVTLPVGVALRREGT